MKTSKLINSAKIQDIKHISYILALYVVSYYIIIYLLLSTDRFINNYVNIGLKNSKVV